MKIKFCLITFLISVSLIANSQIVVFDYPEVFYQAKNTFITHHLILKSFENQKFNIVFNYYNQDKLVDNFDSIYISNNNIIGSFYYFNITQKMQPAIYKCNIAIKNSATSDSIAIQKNIEVSPLADSLSITPINLFAYDSNINFTPILIENFCDTNVYKLLLTSQIAQPQKAKTDLNLYIRITKKGKPNHILFSKVDTISFVKTQKAFNNILDYKTIIPLQYFTNGNYVLWLSLFEKEKLLKRQELIFQCLRPKNIDVKPIVASTDEFSENLIDINKTFVGKYSLAEISKNILSMQAITTPNQFKIIQQLVDTKNDTLAKRYFYNFWVVKNSKNPEAAWRAYADNLNICIKNYGGVNTDRAITFLRYGKPDKTEDVPNEPNTIPYEIWQYENINGINNVVFLYILGKGMGDNKTLLHSTLPGEKKYLHWQQFLIKGETANNRALEYLQENGNSK